MTALSVPVSALNFANGSSWEVLLLGPLALFLALLGAIVAVSKPRSRTLAK